MSLVGLRFKLDRFDPFFWLIPLVIDAYAGWDKNYRMKVRVICSRAYHALFMRNMLVRPTDDELKDFGEPDFTIYNAGKRENRNSGSFLFWNVRFLLCSHYSKASFLPPPWSRVLTPRLQSPSTSPLAKWSFSALNTRVKWRRVFSLSWLVGCFLLIYRFRCRSRLHFFFFNLVRIITCLCVDSSPSIHLATMPSMTPLMSLSSLDFRELERPLSLPTLVATLLEVSNAGSTSLRIFHSHFCQNDCVCYYWLSFILLTLQMTSTSGPRLVCSTLKAVATPSALGSSRRMSPKSSTQSNSVCLRELSFIVHYSRLHSWKCCLWRGQTHCRLQWHFHHWEHSLRLSYWGRQGARFIC